MLIIRLCLTWFDGTLPYKSSGQVNDVPHAENLVGHPSIHTRGTSDFFHGGGKEE